MINPFDEADQKYFSSLTVNIECFFWCHKMCTFSVLFPHDANVNVCINDIMDILIAGKKKVLRPLAVASNIDNTATLAEMSPPSFSVSKPLSEQRLGMNSTASFEDAKTSRALFPFSYFFRSLSC